MHRFKDGNSQQDTKIPVPSGICSVTLGKKRSWFQLSDPAVDGLRSLLYCLPSKSVQNIIFIITQIHVSAGELFYHVNYRSFKNSLLLYVLRICVLGGGGAVEASRCLSCPPEQTQAPLEACFALPILELT